MNFALICLTVLTIVSNVKSQEYYKVTNTFRFTPTENTILERVVRLSMKDFSSGAAKDKYLSCGRVLVKRNGAGDDCIVEGYNINCESDDQQVGESFKAALVGNRNDPKALLLDNFLLIRMSLYHKIDTSDKKIVGMYQEDFEELGNELTTDYEFSSDDSFEVKINHSGDTFTGIKIDKASRRLLVI